MNDNLGRWRSSFPDVISECRRADSAGKDVIEQLLPEPTNYTVKPRHSGFYGTCLELLLEHLGAQTLLICGFAAESCIVFTAQDAYLRGYQLVACPPMAPNLIKTESRRAALAHVRDTLGAKTPRVRDLSFVGKGPRARLRITGKGKASGT